MLKLIIVEDSVSVTALFLDALSTYCKDVSVVSTAGSVADGVKAITLHKPDLVILDVELPDGTGFDMLRQLPEINFKVIFSTAHQEYALQAIKFCAFDYILKPIVTTELISAVQRAQVAHNTSLQLNLEALSTHINQQTKDLKKIVLKSHDSIDVVTIKDIVRCESEKGYTFIFLKNGKRILVSRNLSEYEDLLLEFNFFRVHQSHLINLDYLEKYKKQDSGFVIMSDKSEVPVSSRKKNALLQHLNNL